jgi:predicted dehydrogenase
MIPGPDEISIMPKTTSKKAGRVNVAVVGLGFMGVMHLRAWQKIKHANIVAVCGRSRLPVNGKVAGVAGNLAGSGDVQLGRKVNVYSDFDALLADENVDLIDLCTPTTLHHVQAIAALKAGKHVLCEKPMAHTAALAVKIKAAADEAMGRGKFFMPGMVVRFWPEWAWLKQAVERGTYGTVLAARFRRVTGKPGWNKNPEKGKSGGALLELHIHDADFVQFLFGVPTSVFATGRSVFSGAIDHVVAQYQVASGAVVHAEASWLMSGGHGFRMAYTVAFEKATVDFDSSRQAEALCLYEADRAPRVIKCKGAGAFHDELSYLADCIRRGQPPAIVTAQDGLNAVRICEAAGKSIKTGGVVKLNFKD